MAYDKGLKCSRSHFFRIIRNPVYCGLIPIKFNFEEQQMVKGVHDPLILETLFYEVQNIINTKRRVTAKTDSLKSTFFLRGFLTCPLCGRKLSGSFSKGSTKKYPYYHCQGRCKTRINAPLLNDCYQHKLQQYVLSNEAVELFKIILEDCNTNSQKTKYLQNRNMVIVKLNEENSILSKARKLFVMDTLKFDDYSELKKESLANSKCLKRELEDINVKLKNIEEQSQLASKPFVDIFQEFSSLDTANKKHLVNLISPVKINPKTGDISLELNGALSKILILKNKQKSSEYEFYK